MGAPDWVDVCPIENGDLPASYVSLPEGNWSWLTSNPVSKLDGVLEIDSNSWLVFVAENQMAWKMCNRKKIGWFLVEVHFGKITWHWFSWKTWWFKMAFLFEWTPKRQERDCFLPQASWPNMTTQAASGIPYVMANQPTPPNQPPQK